MKTNNKNRANLNIEQLESRDLMSATLVGGLLTVTGTIYNDTIRVSQNSATIRVDTSYKSGSTGASSSQSFPAAKVDQIKILGYEGRDSITTYGVNVAAEIRGGPGNDSLYGGLKGDMIYGQGGNDLIYGNEGNDTLDGGENNDSLYGYTGNDDLYGGLGNDLLKGGADNDHLIGGAGSDTLDGGNGASLVNSTMQIKGNADNNDALVAWSGSYMKVQITNGPAVTGAWLVDPTTTSTDYFDDAVTKLTFDGYAGNDAFDNETLVRAVANGGSGTNAVTCNAGDMISNFQAVDMNNLPSGHAQPSGSNTCGPNSAWRVINAYGGFATLQQVIDRASNSSLVSKWNLGTTGATLVNAMNDLRRGLDNSFSLVTHSSLDRLIGQLASGKPVVAMIRVAGTEVYEVGGKVGSIIGSIPVIGGITRYEIPKLHWIAVDGFDRAKKLIYYTDTNGGRYQMSYSSFESVWKWNFGAVQNKLLQGLGVVSGTYIVKRS